VQDDIDAVLDPVVARQTTKRGRNTVMKLGDKEVWTTGATRRIPREVCNVEPRSGVRVAPLIHCFYTFDALIRCTQTAHLIPLT
jgi:hypothetical protein